MQTHYTCLGSTCAKHVPILLSPVSARGVERKSRCLGLEMLSNCHTIISEELCKVKPGEVPDFAKVWLPPPRYCIIFQLQPIARWGSQVPGPRRLLESLCPAHQLRSRELMPASAASGSRWKLANHLWFAYVHAAAWWIKTIQWRQQNWKKVIQQSAVHIRSNNVEQVSMLTFSIIWHLENRMF